MPRTKKTKRGHSNHQKVHKDRIGEYSLGEHVIIVGKGSDPKKYVVKIVDLWEDVLDNVARFTAKYYYYPSDLPPEFMSKIPSRFIQNEIFLSNFTAENSLKAIVSKCMVMHDSTTQVQHIQNKSIFTCRYQFIPWNSTHPFVALESKTSHALSNTEIGKPIGPEFQAIIPELEPKTASRKEAIKCDKSVLVWKPCNTVDITVHTYLFLIQCLQLAVGNYVYAWQADLKEEIPCIVVEHLKDGKLRIVFADGSDVDVVLPKYVRGVIQEDEALAYLHDLKYDYANALVKVTMLLNERNLKLRKELMVLSNSSIKKTETKASRSKKGTNTNASSSNSNISSTSSSGSASSSSNTSPPNSNSKSGNTRSARRASVVALQRIYSNA